MSVAGDLFWGVPVKFVQYYLDCLSQASYLIGDETTGRAAVVDPRRDVQEYLDDAAAGGLSIELVIETHVHADFLSGHLELAAATGAAIVYGAAADVHFPHRKVADGERIELGQVALEFRATPGHTPESICIVVWEAPDASAPYGVLTGDTLFIGDVGRPDLVAAQGRSPEEMAAELYRSLHTRVLTLPDPTRVYPAHGAGSACGKNLSTETSSTLGEQRRSNYALRMGTVSEFVAAVTEGQPPRPGYFARVAELNRESHQLADVEEPAALALEEVLRRQAGGAVVLDVRSPEDFARGHLRGSVNVGLDGRFAEYAAQVASGDIVLVCEPGRARDARLRLARVGMDSVTGALDQPVPAFIRHPEVTGTASRLTGRQLADARAAVPGLVLLDVRGPGEHAEGAIEDSVHIPLGQLRDRLGELDPDRPVVTYCAGGYRSSIAASLLRASGFTDVSDLIGGYQAWRAAA
jgi:hydroxyacylglutathione hydrolase